MNLETGDADFETIILDFLGHVNLADVCALNVNLNAFSRHIYVSHGRSG